MKKLLTFILLLKILNGISQSCAPNASSTFEASQMRMLTNSAGNIGTMLEFPKRTQKEIDQGKKGKFLTFDGGIHLVQINNGRLYKSESNYGQNENRQFTPGPINLKNGEVDWQSCEVFDQIWHIDRIIVDNFIVLVKNSYTFPLPQSSIPAEILQWPAKGNKLYSRVPIHDDLAPFYDFNGNGRYDPEYGDFPMFKGDQAQFTVVNDAYHQKFRTDTTLGIEMHIMAYNYAYTYPLSTKNAIFYNVKVTKKTPGDIDSFIFSLFMDPDLGNFNDDLLGCHPPSNSVFTYNGDNYDDPSQNGTENYGYNPPVFISSFIMPHMYSYAPYFNGVGLPLHYPRLLYYFTNNDSLRFLYSWNPSSHTDTNSTVYTQPYARDWRYFQNTSLTPLPYNQTKTYEFMLYTQQYRSYNSKPNIYDSILRPLDSIKNNLPVKNCHIEFSATITPCVGNLKNGKIELTNIIGEEPILAKWAHIETSKTIRNKDSGKYHVVIIDANNCMKDSTLYIPYIQEGTGAIANDILDGISIFPNPFENQLTINNPSKAILEDAIIYDVLGKMIYKTTLNNRNELSDLNLKALSRGTYHMLLSTEHGIKNFKITK